MDNLTTILVAVLGAGGLAAAIREVVTGLSKARNGVSTRETGRRNDLVERAERAERGEQKQRERAEREYRNRWKLEEYASRLRLVLITRGIDLPDQPAMEDTMGTAAVRGVRAAHDREEHSE